MERETSDKQLEQAERKPGLDNTELLGVLQRVAGLLEELRGRFDTSTREQRHREFSAARLIGAILQALVLGFVFAALADWAYGVKEGPQLVKLAFAGVLQLGALTAFVLSRGKP